ncbi:MAG: hypothetical protein V4480_02620 [Patescibacteria group bacterium]
MALSPGIPTSFVPKQPVQPSAGRAFRGGNNLFFLASLGVLGIVALMCAGVFIYQRYLAGTLAAKEQQLTAAQSHVDQNTIEDFVRLRDRLSSGKDLLTNHVMLSQFFDTLETLTLANVRFNDMKLIVAGDHTAQIEVDGTAKNFNTLAAQSNAFATEKRIKRAIFSGITLTEAKLVKFKLTADIDPRLVIAGAATAAPSGSGATTLPAPAGALPQASSSPLLKPQAVATTTAPRTAATSTRATTTTSL